MITLLKKHFLKIFLFTALCVIFQPEIFRIILNVLLQPFLEKHFEKRQELCPLVQEFIKMHLSKCGITNFDRLKIKKLDSDGSWAGTQTLHYNWLFVPHDDANILSNILTLKQQKPDLCKIPSFSISLDNYLKEVVASLHHEAWHIINNDILKAILTASLIFFIVSFLILYSRKKIIVSSGSFLEQCITGSIIMMFSSLIFYQYRHFQEFKADDHIKSNVQLLKAAIRVQKTHLSKEYTEILSQKLKIKDFYDTPLMEWFVTHPHPKARIKRLKQRIKALRQKGDPEAFRNPLDIKEQDVKS